MGCTKVKQNCGKKVYAKCVEFQGVIPEYSTISDQECLDVEEVIENLYEEIEIVKDLIDVSEIDTECLDLENPTLKTLITEMLQKICELETTVTEQGELITTLQAQVADLQENNCP